LLLLAEKKIIHIFFWTYLGDLIMSMINILCNIIFAKNNDQ